MYIGMGIVLALFLLRFMAAFRVVFLILIAMGLVAFLLYWGLSYSKRKRRRKAYEASIEGRVDQQLDRIHLLMEKNNEELLEIGSSIQSIIKKSSNTQELSFENKKEFEGLLKGYRQERKLREAKKDFFEACDRKLNGIISNQNLADELKLKKQKLLELREDQYEELAELETIKYDLETDIFYLDAIDELSEKMISSNSYESANNIQLELEKMAEQLDRE